MPRRTAITSSLSSSSPPRKATRPTAAATQAPPVSSSHRPSATVTSPSSPPRSSQPLIHPAKTTTSSPSSSSSSPAVVVKKKQIVRPLKRHETPSFLTKESASFFHDEHLSIRVPPWHLGWRASECYRLATTLRSASVNNGALHVEPIAWGYGSTDGALGHFTSQQVVSVKKKIAAFRKAQQHHSDPLRQVAAGNRLSLFLTQSGRVLQCGRLFRHQDGVAMTKPTEVKCEDKENEFVQVESVEAGHLAAYAVDQQGRVFAWGTNKYGQLGLGDKEEDEKEDKEEELLDQANSYGGSNQEEEEEEGSSDASDKEEDNDQEGGPHVQNQGQRMRRDPVELCPKLITSDGLHGVRMVKLSAGNHFVLAQSSDGRAFSWGWNAHGQLGLGSLARHGSPHEIQSLRDWIVVDLSAGHSHALAVATPRKSHFSTVDYTVVFSWGRDHHGQLGIGDDYQADQPSSSSCSSPVEVAYFRGLHATRVVAGFDHSLVLCCAGASTFVYAFGGNACGQLGIARDTMSRSSMPMCVDELNGTAIVQIGAGAYVSSALSGDGQVYTWGEARHGKTARPDNRTTFVPWKIASNQENKRVVLDDHDGCVTQLAMGAHHSLALYRTQGKPDRWRQFPLGEFVAALPLLVDDGDEATVAVADCKSSHASSQSCQGIALRCETCRLGPVCRVCVRRCHIGHKLVPWLLPQTTTTTATAQAVATKTTIACGCGARRPPRPSLPMPVQVLKSKPPPPPAQPASTGNSKDTADINSQPVYCTMAIIILDTVQEDTILR